MFAAIFSQERESMIIIFTTIIRKRVISLIWLPDQSCNDHKAPNDKQWAWKIFNGIPLSLYTQRAERHSSYRDAYAFEWSPKTVDQHTNNVVLTCDFIEMCHTCAYHMIIIYRLHEILMRSKVEITIIEISRCHNVSIFDHQQHHCTRKMP